MKKIKLLATCYLLLTVYHILLPKNIFAYSPGENSFAYLKIPDSARVFSSYGGSAMWKGVDCWKLNPASLAFKPRKTLSFTRNAWYQNTYLQSVSFNFGHFAGMWKGYSISDTQRDSSGNRLGDFENNYAVWKFSFAMHLKRYTSIGIAYKKLDQTIYRENYNHSAYDIGFLTLPSARTSYGIVFSNLGGSKKYKYEKDSLPRQVQAGTIRKMGRFFLSAEIKYNPVERPLYLMGIEFNKSKNLTLRIGSSFQDDFNISFGAGWRDAHYFVDFAFLPNGTIGNSFIVTTGLKF
ncbi:MAG: hypothetical protein J7L54_06460 [Elusimicrobia bacterium]|nr:hypothetical protein [Elusimicrobiota bacterium]